MQYVVVIDFTTERHLTVNSPPNNIPNYNYNSNMEKMDFKGKLKGFISDSKQKLLSPGSGGAASDPDSVAAAISLAAGPLGCLADRTQWTDSDREVSQLTSDPILETEVVAGLEEEYYQEAWDSSTHWIHKLGEQLSDLDTIDTARRDLMKQLTLVSRRVFSLILVKQADCGQQLEHVVRVEGQLSAGLVTCRGARAGLATAQRQFVESSLGILASVRRRQQTVAVLGQLASIQRISGALERAEQLARAEDWAGAIGLYLECQRLAAEHHRFTAIREVAARLGDSLVMTEELLDSALARQCSHFQPDIYSKLQAAYTMLGKSQTATDQLLMHYTTAAHNTSWQVVYGHVCLMQELPRPPPYSELCGLVQSESFLPCLTDLLRSLWGLLLSYHQLYSWHQARARHLDTADSLAAQYNRTKLEAGLFRIWQDVQSKVKQFVLGSDLSQFSIDSFLHFLDLLHKLITVGREFLSVSETQQVREGEASSLLQDSLVQQCSAYFSAYHSSRLEELATHLDNESWTLVPVKHNFSYHLLAEFSHMASLKSPSKSAGSNSVFGKYGHVKGTPFDLVSADGQEEDILQGGSSRSVMDSDSEDDISEEQKRQLLEENSHSGGGLTSLSRVSRNSVRQSSRPPATGVTVSNTAIMVLRLIGRYSHMMTVLKPIANQVWTGICQLFQYYLYSVHLLFTRENAENDATIYTEKSSQLLRQIYNTVILHEVKESEISKLVGCVREPMLAPSVVIDKEELMFGLSERIVAMESVQFLSTELSNLQNHYKHQLQGDLEVGTFYESCVSVSQDLRISVYIGAIKNSIQKEVILKLMSKVSWDLKDVVSQHSHYVDHLLDQLELFSKNLTKLSLEIPIPKDLQRSLWETVTLICCHLFVDGFSLAKKCTNEGRALMQLDFRQFVVKLEKLSGLKPVPAAPQQHVSNYIKAYYIPESELGAWVEQHTEYTSGQLRALVAANSNNKTKQKLNSLINDLSDRIRR